MKTIDQYFRDWESNTFGFGYGTGEEHVLAALKTFLANVGSDPEHPLGYDYQVLESVLTPTVAWLLINTLCRSDIFEYGTSPRYAWLTKEGEALKAFVDSKTVAELVDICTGDYEEGLHGCFPDGCNCGAQYVDGPVCPNLFWSNRK